MLSQMSKDDLKTLGATLGMSPDDAQSYLFNSSGSALSNAVGPVGGNGLSNNAIFPVSAAGVAGDANGQQQDVFGNYCAPGLVYNTGLQNRSKRMANNATTSGNHVIGTTAANGLFSTNNLNNEFLPYFTINGAFMTWYDVALIRLCDVCDFFQQAPLTKNFDGLLLRIYINTGAMQVGVSQATDAGMSLTASNRSFVNTCPFTINQLPVANLPAGVTSMAVSCTIARSTVSTSLNGTILAMSV